MMEGCSRDVEGEEEDSMKASFGEDVEGEEKDSMKAALREGISLVINSWWLIRRFVRRARGDYGLQPELKLNGLYDCLFSCLIQSNDLPSAIIALKAHLTSFLGDITPLPDNSLQEVCARRLYFLLPAKLRLFYVSIWLRFSPFRQFCHCGRWFAYED
jgi:hypothetical protein